MSHKHTGSCANGADCGFATIIDKSTLKSLRTQLRNTRAKLQETLEHLKGARAPAIYDNAKTDDWLAWYNKRDDLLGTPREMESDE